MKVNMKQEITIDGMAVSFSIEKKNIKAVMEQGNTHRTLTFKDMLLIIYLGLQHSCGYTADEFLNAVQNGQIYTSISRDQYPLSVICRRIRTRIFNMNRNYL